MLRPENVAIGAPPDQVAPKFLSAADHPWLCELIEQHERFVGRRWFELQDHLRWTRRVDVPDWKRRLASQVLAPLHRANPRTIVPPRVARARVFGAAARGSATPQQVVAEVAAGLGTSSEEIYATLFADLERERVVAMPAEPISPTDLALRCNLLVVQRSLASAVSLEVDLEGNARRVVRSAHLQGLICGASRGPRDPDELVRLTISGPYALFRHTRLYGRALASLVPLLAWCRRFRLCATTVLEGRSTRLVLRTGDPIFPAQPPRPFDSKLEERFARDFGRKAPEWELVREPEPLVAGRHLVFPDFAIVHRADPARRWLLEIAGFWTADYVRAKLARYREVRAANLILCIDAARQCDEHELPAHASVVRFRGRVDPATILSIITSPPRR